MSPIDRTRFVGRWVGETQGCDSPAHTWEISRAADQSYLVIKTQWEGEPNTAGVYGKLNERGDGFMLEGIDEHQFVATLLDAEHFIIPSWDTNDVRGDVGPAYDVVFSRPGLAELSAAMVYEKWVERQISQKKTKPQRRKGAKNVK